MTKTSILIIGSGFGGQCAAINLLKSQITDFLILERRSFMGGTWCQNSYPGAAVDVQSPLYSISHEPHPWTRMFAHQAELQAYTEKVIAKYGLREKTHTNTNVASITWLEDQQTWQVKTDGGEVYEARIVINASGPLSTPVIPNFPGRDQFRGKSFHTNAWDHSYDHRGKRVAIIGSGASAAQVIPAIASEVAELHVFQRTPHWVLPRPDREFGPILRRLVANRFIHRLIRTAIYWGLETRVIGFKYSRTLLNKAIGGHARALLKRQVPDPVLRAKLTPDYDIGCKRIILSNTLFPALSRKNVQLHDKTDGIAEITPTGIRTQQGQVLDLDLIVYSTGYDATDGVISYPVIGKAGRRLSDAWADFPRAYLGTVMPGFPNLFIVTGPNTGIGHTSAIFVIESQMLYIMNCVKRLLGKGVKTIEVTEQAEARYTEMIHREMQQTVWQSGGCTSWYKSKSGKVIAMYPGFTFMYRLLAARFQAGHHLLTRN